MVPASYSEPVGSNLRRDFQLDDLILVIKSYAIEEPVVATS